MNQRKGGWKCQLQPKPGPATLALLAQPFWLQFAPFPVCPRTTTYYIQQHHEGFLDIKLSAALIFAHNLLFIKVFASSPLRGIGSLVTFFLSSKRNEHNKFAF